MKVADLYIRVSTDEQANKGYSLRYQEEVLRKYCQLHNINIRNVIQEDHSAKTFKRPAWSHLLNTLRRHKDQVDFILFTKWDRFSRNTADAYQMIGTLRKLGAEPQSIEQPLDLAVPENKMMLAFYLAAPEVENERRALNTFYGMRRARKEGRYLGIAPKGYKNTVDAGGNKIIAPQEPQASLIQWCFSKVAQNTYAADQIRKMANKKGLVCSRSNFWTLLRNPVYCGKIKIAKHKDEEACLVDGTHLPLITEKLFYEVQDVLEGRKKYDPQKPKVTSADKLPLRGFLVCPKCGKMLTGSASRSSGKNYYYYYHCISSCGCRYRADKVNVLLQKELKKYKLQKGMDDVYRTVIKDLYGQYISGFQKNRKKIIEQIERLNQKLTKTRNLLIEDAIDTDDYQEVKNECQQKIRGLEASLANIAKKSPGINSTLDKALKNLAQLDKLFNEANITDKRTIISAIWPENLMFDGEGYRTNRLNSIAGLIYTVNQEVIKNKSREKMNFSRLSARVAGSRIELLSDNRQI